MTERLSITTVCRDHAFDEIADTARRLAAFALALSRAAERRSEVAVDVHIAQARLCVLHLIEINSEHLDVEEVEVAD